MHSQSDNHRTQSFRSKIAHMLREREWTMEILVKFKAFSRNGFFAKSRHHLAWNRLPDLVTFADKIRVRDYVAEKLGPNFLVPIYEIASKPEQINWSSLPRDYVVKVNHGCRGIIVVSEKAEPSLRLPDQPSGKWGAYMVHPDSLDLAALHRHINSWLSLKYGWNPGNYAEWAYSKVEPLVFIEKLLSGSSVLARNLKIACYSGQAVSFIVTSLTDSFDEVSNHRCLIEDVDLAASEAGLSMPDFLDICRKSEMLASVTDRVRVDWLITEDGVKFSELTNYPGTGVNKVSDSPNRTAAQVEEYYSSYWFAPMIYTAGTIRRSNAKARKSNPGLFG